MSIALFRIFLLRECFVSLLQTLHGLVLGRDDRMYNDEELFFFSSLNNDKFYSVSYVETFS